MALLTRSVNAVILMLMRVIRIQPLWRKSSRPSACKVYYVKFVIGELAWWIRPVNQRSVKREQILWSQYNKFDLSEVCNKRANPITSVAK